MLVAAQVAISIVLLVGAGLFLRTLINLKQLDPGFEREAVLAVRLEPRGSNQMRQNGLRYRFEKFTVAVLGSNLGDRRDAVQLSELGEGQFYRLPARRIDATRTWHYKP